METTLGEIVRLRSFLNDMGVCIRGPSKSMMWPQKCNLLATNHAPHGKINHNKMDCHFVGEEFLTKCSCFLMSNFQIADFFTKGFGAPKFSLFLANFC